MIRLRLLAVLACLLAGLGGSSRADAPGTAESTFAAIKHDRAKLRGFLQALPKGGVLHTHLTGELNPDLQISLAAKNGYFVRVSQADIGRVRVERDVAFKMISPQSYERVPPEHRDKFQPLALWLEQNGDNAGRLRRLLTMQESESIQEFFGPIFDRMDEVSKDERFQEAYYRDILERAHRHAVGYLELRISPSMATRPGQLETYARVTDECNRSWPDEEAVEVRFIVGVHRGRSQTATDLKTAFEVAAADDDARDLIVGVDLVGLEEANGAPADYLETLQVLRAAYPRVHVTLHAGESNERTTHVRDSMLLGARRIGHGTNLILDQPDSMRLARKNGVLVEVSLISNHLLLKKPYEEHPFGAYLDGGIPVSLNTDDGAIFDSTLTDEFTEAVLTFDLTWDQVRALCENSLTHSFARPDEKEVLLKRWRGRWEQFGKNPPH